MHTDPLDHWLHLHGCEEFPAWRCLQCGHVVQDVRTWSHDCGGGWILVTQADIALELAEEAQLSERRWSQR